MINAITLAMKSMDREGHAKQRMIIEIPTIYED
jgi:hypothetical protein